MWLLNTQYWCSGVSLGLNFIIGEMEMISLDQARKFIELRSKDWSFDKISAEMGVSKPTLIKLNKKYAANIVELKKIELDALKEKYFLSERKKIELCGERLLKIKTLLDSRFQDNRGLNSYTSAELLKWEKEYLMISKKIY